MVHKTYNEWKAMGCQVIKGSRSTLKNEAGIALFTDFQVKTAGGNHQQEDYDEADYEITDYELCAGEWGD